MVTTCNRDNFYIWCQPCYAAPLILPPTDKTRIPFFSFLAKNRNTEMEHRLMKHRNQRHRQCTQTKCRFIHIYNLFWLRNIEKCSRVNLLDIYLRIMWANPTARDTPVGASPLGNKIKVWTFLPAPALPAAGLFCVDWNCTVAFLSAIVPKIYYFTASEGKVWSMKQHVFL